MKQRSLILLAACFGICFLLYACRKEIRNMISERDEATSILTKAAKQWHSQHLIPEKAKGKKAISRLSPLWNSSWTMETADKTTLLVVPAREQRLRSRSLSARRFFIFKISGGEIRSGGITEFIGQGYDVEKNLDLLIKNQQQSFIPGFNGAILKYDVNYRFLSSQAYENGTKSSKKIEVGKLTKERKLAGSVQINSSSCEGAIPVQIGFPSDIGPDCTISVYIVATSTPDGCVTSVTYYYLSHTCSGEGGGSGSGSGDGENPPYGGIGGYINQVKNELHNACLIQAYNKWMTGNWANPISQAITNIFTTAENINLTVGESSALSADVDGITTANYNMAGNGSNKSLNVYIDLNVNTLPYASQEYVVATILHEALHAVFKAEGKVQILDHDLISTTEYINQMIYALLEIFPYLNYDNAEGLAWGGLQETMAWHYLSPEFKNNVSSINSGFKNRSFGTPCNTSN
jgi:hypothetical protein